MSRTMNHTLIFIFGLLLLLILLLMINPLAGAF